MSILLNGIKTDIIYSDMINDIKILYENDDLNPEKHNFYVLELTYINKYRYHPDKWIVKGKYDSLCEAIKNIQDYSINNACKNWNSLFEEC